LFIVSNQIKKVTDSEHFMFLSSQDSDQKEYQQRVYDQKITQLCGVSLTFLIPFVFHTCVLGLIHVGCSVPPLEVPNQNNTPSIQDPSTSSPLDPLDSRQVLNQPWPEYMPVPSNLRKLTQVQLKSSLSALLGPSINLPVFTGDDLEVGGFKSVGASIATMSLREVETFESLMLSLAESALDDAESRTLFLKCTQSLDSSELDPSIIHTIQSAQEIPETCIEPTLKSFGLQAWRRPLDQEEWDRIYTLVQRTRDVDPTPAFALKYGLAYLLQSPSFLFRREQTQSSDSLQLDAFDLATRLSFFLWNQPPDQELLKAAQEGVLLEDNGLKEQVNRLLGDDRFRQGLRAFFDEAFHLNRLKYLNKDPTLFEHYYVDLGLDAREETLRLLEYIALSPDHDFREIITSPVSFINPKLAALYSVPSPEENGFSMMVYPESHYRIGVLGHVSFLAHHSHVTSSSVTLRGAAIRSLFLCQLIPNPPVNVDTSIPEPSGNTLTLRQRVAEHLEDPSCSGCHQLMDPIGLALEGFDAIGRWRSTDAGAELDLSGTLDGVSFNQPVELAWAIQNHPDFAPCITQHLTRYALGRIEDEPEKDLLIQLNQRFEAHQYRFRELVFDLIMSPLFRHVGLIIPPTEEDSK
jgi:hypothetical protein